MPGDEQRYELAIVGAGMVGLAHAADALERGIGVVVLEVSVTCGVGMTTAFGLAPAVLDELL